MRKIAAAVLLVCMFFVLSGCGNSNKSVNSDPVSLVTALFESMEKADTDKFLKCFAADDLDYLKQSDTMTDKEFKNYVKGSLQEVKEYMKEAGIKTSEVKIEVPYEYEEDYVSVTVQVTFAEEITYVDVYKDNGKWYINLETMFGLF